jgi:hypothetical protein
MPSRTQIVALVAGLLAVTSAASAGEPAATVDLSVQSAYIWRGMVLNDKPVLQPSLTASVGGLSGSIWANVNLTADYGFENEASEIDYWLAYTLTGRIADWTLTYYAYSYPHTTGVSTQEVWANVTLKSLPLSPSLTAIRDVNAVKGWYFLLTASENLGLLKAPGSDGLLLSANLGHCTREYCRGYFPGLGHDSVTDYGVRLDWPVKVGPGTLKLGVGYTDFTNRNVYTPGCAGERSNFVGGLDYSVGF